jgi:hypothetical protein
MDRENDVPVSWVGQGSESAFNGQVCPGLVYKQPLFPDSVF